jgi:hypothetical protein
VRRTLCGEVLFDNYFLPSRRKAPPPISPMNRAIQPEFEVKVKSQSYVSVERIFNVTIGKASWEAYSATWNFGNNSAFAPRPRKTTENRHRVGQSQDLPEAN